MTDPPIDRSQDTDTLLSALTEAAGILSSEHVERIRQLEETWAGSPFAWILKLPPPTKGKIGKQLVSALCVSNGIDVKPSSVTDADLLINGRPVEVKFSIQGDIYWFEQLRDQEYEYVVCLGLRPFGAHCWVLPKEVAWEYGKRQHGGRRGSDTRMINVDPSAVPSWLIGWGGSLSQAIEILKGF